MIVCAAPAHLDRRGLLRRVAELAQHNCLSHTLSSMQDGKHWAFRIHDEIRVPITGALLANNGDALLAAAVGGQGIVYQPQAFAEAPPRAESGPSAARTGTCHC